MYNEKDSLFISYDDPDSLTLKTSNAKDLGLGGIMFWQLTNDSKDYILLDAIHQESIK